MHPQYFYLPHQEIFFSTIMDWELQCFPKENWNLSMIESHFTSGKGIAIKDSIWKGYALFLELQEEIEILKIGVLPAYRKIGIGTTILQELQNKYSKIFLEVSERNLPAISLYSKMGFTHVGARKKYYTDESSALLLNWER